MHLIPQKTQLIQPSRLVFLAAERFIGRLAHKR